MNQSGMTPEFSLEELEKTVLTASQLASFVLVCRDLEVDLVVLSKEHTRLEGMLGRITDSIHGLVQSLQEQELQD